MTRMPTLAMNLLVAPPFVTDVCKRIKLFLLSISFFGGCSESLAQSDSVSTTRNSYATRSLPNGDSVQVLPVNEFYERILQYHPVARQAGLFRENARQELRTARGEFDPKLSSVLDRKEFGEKLYYNKWDNVLKVPLWIGELKGGYEQNQGAYLNPENSTSGAGLGYVGVSVPLGRGLLMDARRAALRQAQLFQNIAEADRIKEINKLLLNATKDYWTWYAAYYEYELVRESYALAEELYLGTRERVVYGDAAPIDSVEAGTLLQDRFIQLQQAEVNVANARLIVSNYVWGSEDTPLELPATAVPDSADTLRPLGEDTLQSLREWAQTRHPDLTKLTNKLAQLDVEERLQREAFKPAVNVNYNLLSTTPVEPEAVDAAYLTNNYKLGLQVEIPLLWRKAGGKVQQTRIKIAQTDFERMQANREILNAVQTTFNDAKNLEQLIVAQQRIVDSYRQLRDGEVQKFSVGESSVFLVNSRETKLLDAQVKLVSLQAKYEQVKTTLRWAAGVDLGEMLAQ